MSPRLRRTFVRLRDACPPKTRKVIVTAVGGLLLAIGLAMVVLPGPAFVLIPAGFAVLSTEYAWARRMLHFVKRGLDHLREWRRARRRRIRSEGEWQLTITRGFGLPHLRPRRPVRP